MLYSQSLADQERDCPGDHPFCADGPGCWQRRHIPVFDRLRNLPRGWPQRFKNFRTRTLAVTSVKDEAPYVLEWVCFHKTVGFDEIVVVTNDNTDDTTAIVNRIARAFPWFHVIEHSVAPTVVPQMQALRCARTWLDRNYYKGWVLVADIDEFIMLRSAASIKDFLKDFKHADVVFLNWRIYGSSGHLAKPDGLVIEKFTRCAEEDFGEHVKFKSIFRYMSGHVDFIGIHWPVFRKETPKRYVFSDGSAIDRRILENKPYSEYSRACFSGIQLNHYITRSWGEFSLKSQRGSGGKARASKERHSRHGSGFFRRMDKNDVDLPMPDGVVAKTRALMHEVYAEAGLAKTGHGPGFFGL